MTTETFEIKIIDGDLNDVREQAYALCRFGWRPVEAARFAGNVRYGDPCYPVHQTVRRHFSMTLTRALEVEP